MRKLRLWYQSEDNEPLRREIAWIRDWFFRGMGRFWVAAVIVANLADSFLLRGRFIPFPVSSSPGLSVLLAYSGLSSWLTYPLYQIVFWCGWFQLFKRRALAPLASERLEEILVSRLRLSNYLPALTVTPGIWSVVAYTIFSLCALVSFRSLLSWNSRGMHEWLYSNTAGFLLSVTQSLFLSSLVLLRVLRSPTSAWALVNLVAAYMLLRVFNFMALWPSILMLTLLVTRANSPWLNSFFSACFYAMYAGIGMAINLAGSFICIYRLRMNSTRNSLVLSFEKRAAA